MQKGSLCEALTWSCESWTIGLRADCTIATSSGDIPAAGPVSLIRKTRVEVMQAKLLPEADTASAAASTSSVASRTCLYVPSIRVSKLVRGVGVLSLKRASRRRSMALS